MANSLIKEALSDGYITQEQRDKAESYKRETGVSEEYALLETKALSEEQILNLQAKLYRYPIQTELDSVNSDIAKGFKSSELIRLGFFPENCGNIIKIITAKPSELLYAEDYIRERLGYKGGFIYFLVTESAISRLVEDCFKGASTSEDINIDGEEVSEGNVYDIAETDSSAVVSLVNKIFKTAIERNASDVHLEPRDEGFIIRFREDGTLKVKYTYPLSISRQVINRIKTMANMDVNTSKSIQDGNTRLNIYGKSVDLRISVIPSAHGENMVVRILDRNKMKFDVSMIGFSKDNEIKFQKLIKRPQGIILLTGPTGSGKSTSLYAALSALNTEDRCIITFEDPIEYRIPGIVQVQVNQAMGVDFASALKSGLRQDIEVALVGEIRDNETASIAFDAANTGHMVFSTLHTNSAASSIIRLIKMGVDPHMVSRSLVAVINQRLAKRICPYCREEYLLEQDSPYRQVLNCGNKEVKLYRGKGCNKCNGDGYKGRIAIQEFLSVDNIIGEMIDNGATTYEIEQAAVKGGMKKIQTDGIEKALKGITTLDEVHRTVFFDNL